MTKKIKVELRNVKVSFRTMTCRKCGTIWDPIPPPEDVDSVIQDHKKTCGKTI